LNHLIKQDTATITLVKHFVKRNEGKLKIKGIL
jgi:hypothetical protein